ncbi:hypothetical protein ACJJTC_012735 [Scirpophaga incertulas]
MKAYQLIQVNRPPEEDPLLRKAAAKQTFARVYEVSKAHSGNCPDDAGCYNKAGVGAARWRDSGGELGARARAWRTGARRGARRSLPATALRRRPPPASIPPGQLGEPGLNARQRAVAAAARERRSHASDAPAAAAARACPKVPVHLIS